MTFQSGRCARMSLPIIPRSGMKGTPFSAACSMVWTAGQVQSRTTQRAGADGGREARREAGLAERDGAGLDLGDAAGADQHVGGEAGDRHAEQPQPAGAAAHQRLGQRHRGQGIIGRQGDKGAIGDARGHRLQADRGGHRLSSGDPP